MKRCRDEEERGWRERGEAGFRSHVVESVAKGQDGDIAAGSS